MASATGMNNLSTLIKRLEAATSRLEDIASSTSALEVQQSTKSGAVLSPAVSQGGDVPFTSGAPSASAPVAETTTSAPLRAFDYLVDNELKAFSDIGKEIGGVVAEQATAFTDAFLIQREILMIVDTATEPAQTSSIVQEIMQKGQDVAAVLSKHPKSPQDNQLQMGAAGINIIGWVIPGTGLPADFISMMEESAEYYGNQVLKAFKGQPDAEYVRAFRSLCKALKDFAKQNYPKGLQWQKSGASPEEALASLRSGGSSGGAPNAAGSHQAGPPPPPPPPLPKFDDLPPPPPPASAAKPSSRAAGGDMNAVFDQLNRGESVTAGLRKVQASEMTHKNPALRSQTSGGSTQASSGPSNRQAKPETTRPKRPASKVLDGNRWTIENYEDVSRQNPIRIDAERQHSILISRCNSSVVQIVGKANAISVDNCSRLLLVVDDLVSSIEVINSSRVHIDINGSLPSIQLDKVDGATVALSRQNASTRIWPDIFTSKCTSVNIGLGLESEEDSIELPVPEQIKSRIVDGRLVSEIVRIDA